MEIQSLLQTSSALAMETLAGKMIAEQAIFQRVLNITFERKPYSWRAAWALFGVAEKRPALVEPFTKRIIDEVLKGHGPQTDRGLLRILTRMHLHHLDWGNLYDYCLQVLTDPKQTKAMQHYAMELIAKFLQMEPELKAEVSLVMDTVLPNLEGYSARSKARLLREQFHKKNGE